MPYHHGNLREVLLQKAAEAIEEVGIAALSLRDVARRAGVSHGAPAHHFQDKPGLLTALATRGMDRFRAALARAAHEAGDSAVARVRAMGLEYVRFATQHPALFRMSTRMDLIRRDDPALEASYRATFELLREAVMAARQEGWGRDMDSLALVVAGWATAHGLATLWLDGVLEDQVGRIDIEALTAHVLRVVTAG